MKGSKYGKEICVELDRDIKKTEKSIEKLTEWNAALRKDVFSLTNLIFATEDKLKKLEQALVNSGLIKVKT